MGGFAFYDANGKFLYHLWDPRFSEHFQNNNKVREEQKKMRRKLSRGETSLEKTVSETSSEETVSAHSANDASSVFSETSGGEIEETVSVHSSNDIHSF